MANNTPAYPEPTLERDCYEPLCPADRSPLTWSPRQGFWECRGNCGKAYSELTVRLFTLNRLAVDGQVGA